MRALSFLLWSLLPVSSVLAAAPPLRPVTVDLARYAGPWKVVAFMDNKAEHDFVDATESYRMEPKGKVAVHFSWRSKSFTAPLKTHDFKGSVVPDGTNGYWKMHIFPLTTQKYYIIDLAPDYSVATIGHPSRKFGWILARQRTISPAAYQRSMRAMRNQGYDTTKLIRLPQLPAQVAKSRALPAQDRS